ncbi:response regulator [Lyngbya confervoides]|uniref:Response regulator transcription factor n=1 Tax=Lyngbya confervoides BDU141951 TaxID=1574623 RepID=A0ABD4SZ64_9CYAN|nr:response regulator transcription factor [Lyngbya confervoides]MCM1981569.1 response regulator transcription factor [Lyngbya confervoides BDU141951]
MSHSPLRVIIIEDHVLTRMGLESALGDCADIEVVGEAGSGAEGLNLLSQTPCDVAIVDVGLPDFDGIELINRFRQLRLSAQPHFLILTMHDQKLQVLSAFAAGADSYCVKDTDLDLLIEAVRTTGEGQSWIDPAIASIVLEHVRQDPAGGGPREILIRGLHPEEAEMIEKFPLTDRELGILELIVEGQSNAAIADTLHLSIGTVKTHVRNILSKLCASDRTEAAVRALRSGLVQ